MRDRKHAARQFQGSEMVVDAEGLAAIARAHAEEGKVPAARKLLEVARGVRHSVHFMKRVGKIGDAGQRSPLHPLPAP